VGGVSYLGSLVDGVPRATNVEAYARIVRDKWCRRQLIFSGNKLLGLAYDDEDMPLAELMEKAERQLVELSREQLGADGGVATPQWMGESMNAVEALYNDKRHITGCATGIRKLDELTRGFQRGDVVFLAGRPSMGKTALVLQMALRMATQGTLPFFSLEMNRRQLGIRALAVQAQVHTYALLTGYISERDLARIADAANAIAQLGLVVDDTVPMTTQLLRSRARRLAATRGRLAAIIIDYIGLIDTSNIKAENRQTAVARISQDLKALAKELDVPVLALSQLSRAPEARSDKRPQMSDLRESGALEQDADVVMLLHRPEYYEKVPKNPGLTEVIVAKQRNGATGTVQLNFVKEQTRFEPWKDEGAA
jgi:replicative DNA helicase